MGNIFIPSEDDLRRWVREAVADSLEKMGSKGPPSDNPDAEPLLTRKEIAHMFRISLVTLHDWMKRGLPCNKQRGRVYFLRSEVMRYIQENRRKTV